MHVSVHEYLSVYGVHVNVFVRVSMFLSESTFYVLTLEYFG